MGVWFNGRTAVSKTVDMGSIPLTPAIEQNCTYRIHGTCFYYR